MNKILTFFSLGLLLFSQITLDSSWINVTSTDVSKVSWPLYTWFWSFFNMIVEFAPVVIAIVVIWLILKFFLRRRE